MGDRAIAEDILQDALVKHLDHADEIRDSSIGWMYRVSDYADALRRIDIDGVPVKDYAETAGITATNAGVRVFRAREALRKQLVRACGTCAEHGCVDCTCQM